MNLAKNFQCDAKTSVNTPAQIIGPDITEKLTKADYLPQTSAILKNSTICSTCSRQEWYKL
jgi:hypothetical protein